MSIRGLLGILMVLSAEAAAQGAVVVNEIFYHAPDDLDDLEWVEVYNSGEQGVDVGGWAFKKGIQYTFAKGTTIEAKGYIVVCRNPERFKQCYNVPALGGFSSPLSDNGEEIVLVDAAGKQVDAVKYKDSDPWPASADGCSASLERICPSAAGDGAENWAASPMTADGTKPGGTPGKRNACYSEHVPPVVSKATCLPEEPAPGQAMQVQASVKDDGGLREVSLLYRVAASHSPGKEIAVAMTKDAGTGLFTATIPGQEAGRLIRYRIKAVNEQGAARLHPSATDLRPTFTSYVHNKDRPGRIHLGYIINVGAVFGDGAAQGTARPGRRPSIWGAFGGSRGDERPRTGARFGPPGEDLSPLGPAAFVYIDQGTGKLTVFDHINVSDRSGGYKVRLHKDRTLRGMTTINLVLEDVERFVLAEPLSYELFRRVGSPAPATDFVRLTVDGRALGYHLLIEQPNASFLRRNKIKAGGNMYKVLWYGQGVVGQHEKKTNRQTGHEDLVALIGKLQQTAGDEQWKVIEANVNVSRFVNYYAVNMCLSDWDGFFNNYFTYHDVLGTGKWEIYPWDRDKTWGYHDGLFGDEVFTDMPLTFGMSGDRRPAAGAQRPGGFGFRGGPFGGGAAWWRPGGYFSGPLLANPQFRKLFIARTKEMVEKVYTPEVFFPIMAEMEKRLEEEVRIRATTIRRDPDQAVAQLRRNMQSLRDHLTKRREFLLAQPEIGALGKAEGK